MMFLHYHNSGFGNNTAWMLKHNAEGTKLVLQEHAHGEKNSQDNVKNCIGVAGITGDHFTGV